MSNLHDDVATDLTDEQKLQIARAVENVHNVLLERHDCHALDSEADYLAGALAALQGVFGSDAALMGTPSSLWILYPMTGRSVADKLKEDAGE